MGGSPALVTPSADIDFLVQGPCTKFVQFTHSKLVTSPNRGNNLTFWVLSQQALGDADLPDDVVPAGTRKENKKRKAKWDIQETREYKSGAFQVLLIWTRTEIGQEAREGDCLTLKPTVSPEDICCNNLSWRPI